MKNEMNNWRRFTLLEQTEDPTVADFLNTFGKQSPNAAKKIFGKAAKYIISGAVGAGVGMAAGAATGGLGVAAGGVAAKATEAALSKVFDSMISKSGEFAKFLVAMSENQVDDGERTGLALYYDLDDEYEALLQGMDSNLANKFQEELFKYFKEAIGGMGSITPEEASSEPLKNHIEVTANDFLKRFLKKGNMSGVGVHVKSSRREE